MAQASGRNCAEVLPISAEENSAQPASPQHALQDFYLAGIKRRAADMLFKGSDDGSLDHAIKSLSDTSCMPKSANSASSDSDPGKEEGKKAGEQAQRQNDSTVAWSPTQRASTADSAPGLVQRASTPGSAPSRVRPGSGISSLTDLKNGSEPPDHRDDQQELAELEAD